MCRKMKFFDDKSKKWTKKNIWTFIKNICRLISQIVDLVTDYSSATVYFHKSENIYGYLTILFIIFPLMYIAFAYKVW